MSRKKKKLYLYDRPPLTLGGKIGIGVMYLILLIWTLLILVPLFQMFLSAFNGENTRFLSTNETFSFSLRHFKYLFENTHYIDWVFNTLFIALGSTVLSLIVTSLTGYAYSRYRFKGKKASLLTIMVVQTVPTFAGIIAYYTISSILEVRVPGFTRQMMLILIYTGGGVATNTFLLKGYLDSISYELDDAAKMDGCSNITVYRLIIMPIARPMLSVIALMCFVGPFMDYLMPKVLLTSPKTYTLAAGLYSLISDQRTINEPAFAAGGLLIAVPITIFFLFMQKHLVSGLATGSVKG